MNMNFLSNTRGNFAAMFAIATIPVLAGVAMAIEYSSLTNNQSKLQNAVDAAALFGGKHYFENDKLPKKKLVKDFLKANFDGKLGSVSVKIVDDKFVTTAKSKAPAFFYGNLFPSAFDQSAEASIPHSPKVNIDIAMVLDTTRSMATDGKLDSLKTVATSFIDKMEKASNKNTKLKVGIVPFSNHVNVGIGNRNASWIDVPADRIETKEVCRQSWPAGTDMKCHKETRYADGVPYQANACNPTDPSVQTVQTCNIETTKTVWFGCVGSRKDPYMTIDGAYATRMPGVLSTGNWHCPSEITPLTNKFNQLKNGISNLVDRGDTYIAPGVMWGLRLLSVQKPFTEGSDPSTLPSNTQSKKIMIVMTDGDNSRSANQPWSEANWGNDTTHANEITEQACKNARDEGVTIYSIAFGTTISADGKGVMQACAGDPNRYFPASDAKALDEAFKSIGARIFSLRLAS